MGKLAMMRCLDCGKERDSEKTQAQAQSLEH